MIIRVDTLLIVSFLMTVVTACTDHSNSGSGVWNNDISTFLMDDDKLSYTLPTDLSFWAIADSENLPPNMLFFGVDSSEGIGVGIFRPELKMIQRKTAKEYTDYEIDVILRELSNSNQDEKVVYKKIDKNRSKLNGKDSWSYTVEHKLLDKTVSNDTVHVFYSGYVFDGLKNTYGFVMISNINPSDSNGQIQQSVYLSGLTFSK